jgi:5'-methylthioadenosine phosphorylase
MRGRIGQGRREMARKTLGVIGGSGFYQMPGLEKVEQIELDTPFGKPSDPYYRGRIGEVDVVFLARHGCGQQAGRDSSGRPGSA